MLILAVLPWVFLSSCRFVFCWCRFLLCCSIVVAALSLVFFCTFDYCFLKKWPKSNQDDQKATGTASKGGQAEAQERGPKRATSIGIGHIDGRKHCKIQCFMRRRGQKHCKIQCFRWFLTAKMPSMSIKHCKIQCFCYFSQRHASRADVKIIIKNVHFTEAPDEFSIKSAKR